MSATIRGLDDLEIERKQALIRFWRSLIMLIVALPFALAPVWLSLYSGPGLAAHIDMSETVRATARSLGTSTGTLVGVGAAWVLLSAAGLLVWFWRSGWLPRMRYVEHFKQSVFVAACDTHLPGLTYQPNDGFPCREFKATRLFGFPVDIFRSKNRFSGTWLGRDVSLTEVESRHQIEYYSHGENQVSWETHFRGLVLDVKLREGFPGCLRVVPRALPSKERIPKRWRESADPTGDIRFDERFQLLSDRHVEATALLRDGLGQHLDRIAAQYSGLRLHVAQDRMLLLLPHSSSLFSPSLHRRADSDRQVQRFVANARAVLQLVEIAP